MWRNKTETQITKAWVRPVSLDAWLAELSMALRLSYLREPRSHFWGLRKPRLLGYSWVSDSEFLGWGPGICSICISVKSQVMLSHVARPSGTHVLHTLCFPGSEITLEMVAFTASLMGHMMGIAAESYLGSIRWLITEEQQLWIQTQKEWHVDKILGGEQSGWCQIWCEERLCLLESYP